MLFMLLLLSLLNVSCLVQAPFNLKLRRLSFLSGSEERGGDEKGDEGNNAWQCECLCIASAANFYFCFLDGPKILPPLPPSTPMISAYGRLPNSLPPLRLLVLKSKGVIRPMTQAPNAVGVDEGCEGVGKPLRKIQVDEGGGMKQKEQPADSGKDRS